MSTITNTALAQKLDAVVTGHQSFVNQQIGWLTSQAPTVVLSDPYDPLVAVTVRTLYAMSEGYDDIFGDAESVLNQTTELLAQAEELLEDAEAVAGQLGTYDQQFQTYLNQTNAGATSASNAAINAAASQSAAATSAANAAASSTTAGTHAATATTQAGNAATSATQALGYRNTAQASATTATSSRDVAIASAQTAQARADDAAASQQAAGAYKDVAESIAASFTEEILEAREIVAKSLAGDASPFRKRQVYEEFNTPTPSATTTHVAAGGSTGGLAVTPNWNSLSNAVNNAMADGWGVASIVFPTATTTSTDASTTIIAEHGIASPWFTAQFNVATDATTPLMLIQTTYKLGVVNSASGFEGDGVWLEMERNGDGSAYALSMSARVGGVVYHADPATTLPVSYPHERFTMTVSLFDGVVVARVEFRNTLGLVGQLALALPSGLDGVLRPAVSLVCAAGAEAEAGDATYLLTDFLYAMAGGDNRSTFISPTTDNILTVDDAVVVIQERVASAQRPKLRLELGADGIPTASRLSLEARVGGVLRRVGELDFSADTGTRLAGDVVTIEGGAINLLAATLNGASADASLSSLTLGTDLGVTHGGTGASSAPAARANLGIPALDTGTYTPIATGVANVAATSNPAGFFLRVGNVVMGSVTLNVDPTAANVTTQVGISLPVPSALTSSGQCIGTATSLQAWGRITADAGNDRAELQFSTADVSNRTWNCTFLYLAQ